MERRVKTAGLIRRAFLKSSTILTIGMLISFAGCATLTDGKNKNKFKPVSYPKILLHNFRLFDGLENRLQDGLILLINGDRIQSIDRRENLDQYNGIKRLDMNGMTLMPGLLDNHVHMSAPLLYSVNLNAIWQMNRQILYNFRNCVLSGVTTVRDIGGFPGKINKFRKMSDRNQIPGPRVISSLSLIATRRVDWLGAPSQVPYFTNPVIKWILGGNFAERPTGIEEIEEACERMVALGAQWLKTLYDEYGYNRNNRWPNHSDEGYKKILEIGARHGIKCAFHQTEVNGYVKGVRLGYHTLEHIPADAIIPYKYIEEFKNQGMAILPTLMVFADPLEYERILEIINTRGRD